ncbi:FtsX-like permease family protein [Nitrobacter sp. 62-23]|nr:FtsX-like permease family protein [Nitrobacter sp. 62-23]
MIGAVAGVACVVALIAVLGIFLRASSASMTTRAIATVPVDWQIQLAFGASLEAIKEAASKANPLAKVQTVDYASVDGFESSTDGTVQTTGAGQVLGLDPSYTASFPGEIRLLLGSLDGVLVAQQTAANLHVGLGDMVMIHRPGLSNSAVKVGGVIDLPNADSLFQAVGAPKGLAPQAPPDNVLVLPAPLWRELFLPQKNVRPDSVRQQLHIGIDRAQLSSDPGAAYIAATASGHNLEARVAGTAVLANNLAARLDATRGDALYAKVLFLFLGAPGAALAALLTVACARSGADRRRRDQSLLRLRGASTRRILTLSAVEAALVAAGGAVLGLAVAVLAAHLTFGAVLTITGLWPWLGAAVIAGLALALLAVLLPAWSEARRLTVAAARMVLGSDHVPLWRRAFVDLVLIAIGALVFWKTASSGYQVVLAPEGVAAASVDYATFLAPLLMWAGVGLLTVRLSTVGLAQGRRWLTAVLRPVAGPLSDLVAATMGRQRGRLTSGIAMSALALAFATSTAVFNTTYNAQARVDAELTNGADVAVTGTSTAPASNVMDKLAALPGVVAAQPMQHRFAYVGTDLQDIYGIDPINLGKATDVSDAYFANRNAEATLAELAKTPDGVLVSQETVNDYQLALGDPINLRLQSATDHQYHVVPFRFIGIVREFPTAPKDSFLVANATYIAKVTGSDSAEVVLLRTRGNPAAVAKLAEQVVSSLPGLKVRDIGTTQHLIGSSLTAVDLVGLTRIELVFAVIMVAGAAGLVLALGLADRRRGFAILSALGAKPRQLSAFLWSEGMLIFTVGGAIGVAGGFGMAWMLVKLLTGVFDPPPDQLSIPWIYIFVLICAAFASMAAAVIGAQHETRIPAVQRLREM